MKPAHLLFLSLVVFLVIIRFFNLVSNISSSADETCRQIMMKKSGYGPWHPLPAPADEQANTSFFGATTRNYSDGMNTASCGVQRLGPVWYANGRFGTTHAGYSLGLGCPQYPVKAYGVLPAEVEGEEEIRQEFLVFADKVHAEVCQPYPPVSH